MVRAELSKQLMIRLDSKVGSLAHVTSAISSQDINMIALCAYEIEDRVCIMFVTDDNNSAKEVLERQGVQVAEDEVIILTIENKPGAMQHVTDKIADAGINLKLLYGSSDSGAETCSLILIGQDNLEVMMLIKTELERG